MVTGPGRIPTADETPRKSKKKGYKYRFFDFRKRQRLHPLRDFSKD